jgi:hypothetical protein
MKSRVIFICNAFDEHTRRERSIESDSPAGSRKVFFMAKAIKKSNVRPYILSFGRGKSSFKFEWYKRKANTINGIPYIYSSYCSFRFISEIISFFGLLDLLIRLSQKSNAAVVFYNRRLLYIFHLLLAKALGYRCILDLEDSELIDKNKRSLKDIFFFKSITALFDSLCKQGVILACSSMRASTRIPRAICYYGIADLDLFHKKFKNEQINFIFSGALLEDTGGEVLLEAIKKMRKDSNFKFCRICFFITGFGSLGEKFNHIASSKKFPKVVYYGKLNQHKYYEILRKSDVGLALKKIDGKFANTTFPSKVIEFSSAGLLTITTDISDVRKLLAGNALYLKSNDPKDLLKLIKKVTLSKKLLSAKAESCSNRIAKLCNLKKEGIRLRDFIFND